MYSRTRALTLSLSRREKRKHSHFLTRNGAKTHSNYLTEGQAHSLSLSRTLKERLAPSHLQIRQHANFHLQTDTLSGEYTHSRTPAFTLRFSHRGSTAKLHSHTEGEGKLILIVSHRKEGTFIPTFLNRCENTLIHGHTKSARQNSHSPSQGTQSGGRTRTLFHTHGVEGSRSHSFTLSLFHTRTERHTLSLHHRHGNGNTHSLILTLTL